MMHRTTTITALLLGCLATAAPAAAMPEEAGAPRVAHKARVKTLVDFCQGAQSTNPYEIAVAFMRNDPGLVIPGATPPQGSQLCELNDYLHHGLAAGAVCAALKNLHAKKRDGKAFTNRDIATAIRAGLASQPKLGGAAPCAACGMCGAVRGAGAALACYYGGVKATDTAARGAMIDFSARTLRDLVQPLPAPQRGRGAAGQGQAGAAAASAYLPRCCKRSTMLTIRNLVDQFNGLFAKDGVNAGIQLAATPTQCEFIKQTQNETRTNNGAGCALGACPLFKGLPRSGRDQYIPQAPPPTGGACGG